MDNQDIMQIAELLDNEVLVEEEGFEQLLNFFALKHYLTHLTNNGGSLTRIIQVTKMLDKLRMPVERFVNKLAKETE